METDIRIIDVTESTNTDIERLAGEGAREGTCVVSFCQRHGQGRSGRTFFSPEGGNLYMSILLRPRRECDFEMITVTAAVAAAEAVNETFGINAQIKWVNDLIYKGRKIGGIVAQAKNFQTDDMYVILGIGINIYESANVPEEIKKRYGSIMGHKSDKPKKILNDNAVALAKNIISKFAKEYEGGEKTDVIERYRDLSAVIGKTVKYISGERKVDARVIGIDDNGGIILKTEEGVRSYRDGEIRINLA
ncbi:MAG: biotin--[acetyl-CoA-carboxylase] ligase [Lachnospiraceae bacterium]|nr:biotin--[acetyl-CoA-carboxylase] ligase [Lachnospiraceae bacterium]